LSFLDMEFFEDSLRACRGLSFMLQEAIQVIRMDEA